MYKNQVNRNENQYCPPSYVDSDGAYGVIQGQWRNEENRMMGLRDVDCLGWNNYSVNAKLIRNEFR